MLGANLTPPNPKFGQYLDGQYEEEKKTSKPQPVATVTVCSICELDWDLHGENPTTDDCIRLLKSELATVQAELEEAQIPEFKLPAILPYCTRPHKDDYHPIQPWPQPIIYGGGTIPHSDPRYQITCGDTSGGSIGDNANTYSINTDKTLNWTTDQGKSLTYLTPAQSTQSVSQSVLSI